MYKKVQHCLKKQVLSLDNNYCFIAQWYDTQF